VIKKEILCTIETRPEAIKMAPINLALCGEPSAELKVLTKGQHREIVDQMLPAFGITPNIYLDVMRPNQDLTSLTARVMQEVGRVLQVETPDAVLVQSDTTSVMAVTLAAFYQRIPLGHVEAGLRAGNIDHPFPEEMNRVITARLVRWHSTPTETSRRNLLRENVPESDICVTGNTVIDTLLHDVTRNTGKFLPLDRRKKLVIITAQRRESFGAPIRRILAAIRSLALGFPDVQFLYPVHPNPNILDVAHVTLAGIDNVVLCEPLDYFTFAHAMRRAYIMITDSGGVQEEAPAIGLPTLALRDETERPEAVEMGAVQLVGTDHETIVRETARLLTDKQAYEAMAKGGPPYGDGKVSARIVARRRLDMAP